MDEAYLDRKSWTKKCIRTGDLLDIFSPCRVNGLLSLFLVAHMGKFSSDRAIMQYAEEVCTFAGEIVDCLSLKID